MSARDRPVRAVAEGALTMLAALVLILVVALIWNSISPESFEGDSFYWAAVIGGPLILLAASGFAGWRAARRLPLAGRARTPLAMAGPVALSSLIALFALTGGQWVGALLYAVTTLAGTVIGAILAARRGSAAS